MMTIDESMEAAADELGARRVDRRALAVTIVATVVLTAVVGWLGLKVANQDVRWSDVGYSIVSPTEATTTFDVYLYTGASATCRVHALNDRFSEVGYADVEVVRSAGIQQRLTVPIVTVEPAVTAVVAYCTPA
jgi:hypothetical protein